jgi:hypothetical protein
MVNSLVSCNLNRLVCFLPLHLTVEFGILRRRWKIKVYGGKLPKFAPTQLQHLGILNKKDESSFKHHNQVFRSVQTPKATIKVPIM